jgi:hypothetical protein
LQMKSTRLRKPAADSSEASVEALSITMISEPFVVAKSESMHVHSRFPEFQLMTAIALVIYVMAAPFLDAALRA